MVVLVLPLVQLTTGGFSSWRRWLLSQCSGSEARDAALQVLLQRVLQGVCGLYEGQPWH